MVYSKCSENAEYCLQKKRENLPDHEKLPWPNNYRPEINVSPDILPTNETYFQYILGVLRWVVELGREDTTVEKSTLASMIASPHEGHIKEVFHIFAFPKGKHNILMVFDPTGPDIDLSKFPIEYWFGN